MRLRRLPLTKPIKTFRGVLRTMGSKRAFSTFLTQKVENNLKKGLVCSGAQRRPAPTAKNDCPQRGSGGPRKGAIKIAAGGYRTLFSDWCCYCSIFKILRQSDEPLCINIVALKL